MAIVGHAGQAHRQDVAVRGLSVAPWMRLPAAAVARRALDRVVRIGVREGLPVNAAKRIRLCNVIALGGSVIMAGWAAVEAIAGARGCVAWELGFMAAFLGVLGASAAGAPRLARLLLLSTANACVLAGAVLFTEPSGGLLPFFAMAALPLLLFSPGDWTSPALGAALPALLLVACKTGLAAALLSVHPKPAPLWYFGANAATTFVLAFLVPFFFFRSNLKAEVSLQRIGQEKLKRVIDADLIGVVRGRLSGRIEDANGTFLCLLGYTRQDLAAGLLDLRMIAPPGSSEAELAPLGPSAVYERICRRKDGTTVPTLVGIARLDGAGGEPTDDGNDEVIGFVLDLTAQKRVDAQRALLDDSREALRLRDLFNSIASHELKTPLTALLLNLRLLRERVEREHTDDATLRRQVARCESAAARMGELIHTLLDVAQIHRGKLTLNVRDTEVVEAVRNVVSGFEEGRTAGAHRIAVRADGPFTARVDPLRFDQVVANLLSNAVKYGAGEPIEVRVNHDRAGDLAHLEVIDGGPGIDPGMAEKIFEPFQRATSMEPIPGLGLGLYVVKMIVDEHGGRIAVDSHLGHGTRFIVDLPCAHA
ncbi:MAG TPA: PAS domain-containing sensor histidine kinase [Polyangia bacterium]